MSQIDNIPPEAPAIKSHLDVRKALLKDREMDFVPLRRLNARARLIEMSFFIALLILGMWLNLTGLTEPRIFLQIIGIAFTALALNCFFLLMHEGMHFVLFKDRTANRWVSFLLGATCLMSYSAYRVNHTRHHRYLGQQGDPDDYVKYAKGTKQLWVMQYMRLTIGPFIYVPAVPLSAWRFASVAEQRDALIEYALLLVIYVILFTLLPARLLFDIWLFPLMLAGWLIAIRALTQHGVTDMADPYLASRSIEASLPVRWFMLNENYHLEHHFFPEIPSYHLHAAHQLIAPRLPRSVMMKSYLFFIFRFFAQSLRLDETPIGLNPIPRS